MKINSFSLAAVLLVSWLAGSNVGRAQVPTISMGPTNQVLPVGGTLTMSVTASGATPLAYQWFKDSRLISGATKSTLTVTSAGVTNSGMYYVAVTNSSGTAISLPASAAVGTPLLMAWGDNSTGQLGNGTTSNAYSPVTVASNIVTGAAGFSHSLFVTADGTLWAMGDDTYGELGDGTTNETSVPISIASNVIAVAAGQYYSLFVTTNGTLWAVGYNNFGQLGTATTNNVSQPVSVASNVVAVAAGVNHSLFVKTDGTLWAMGNNAGGQLGNNSTVNTNRPIFVASNVVSVAAGAVDSLFVTTSGTLWGTGATFYNTYGENPQSPFYKMPYQVNGTVAAVAAGEDHSLFLTNSTLWALGYDNYGQLGNSMTNVFPLIFPTNVAMYVTTVAAGENHSLFTTADGKLWTMGYNVYGQLGLGTTNQSDRLVNVPQLFVANIFPGASANHSLVTGITLPLPPTITSAPANQVQALGSTITLAAGTGGGMPQGYQWFKDGRRLLGATNTMLTVMTAGVTNTGTYYFVATNAGGMVISLPASVAVGNPSLLAWGYNDDGQLGNGKTGNTNLPFAVTNRVVAGAAGNLHSLFLTTNGTLWAMGNNSDGQLGIPATYGNYANPIPASVANGVVAIAAGSLHSLFITTNGILWAMGNNSYGQLGNGNTNQQFQPVSIASNVVQVAAGFFHSMFVTKDGTLWTMGENLYGQLGNGTGDGFTPNPTPINVASNVVAVAAGGNHSLFLKADGTMWAMGYNNYGQLGIGTFSDGSLSPIMVASNVVTVVGGAGNTLFVTADGTLWVMGQNNYGQLGLGNTENLDLPVNVASNVIAAAAGYNDSLFVKADGSLWTMGYNAYGELGIGTTSNSYTPVEVSLWTMANVFPGATAYHSLAVGMNFQATVTLGNLTQNYTGGGIDVAVSTTPSGLTVNLTYNGSPDAPTNEGSYTVVATVSDPYYYGGVTNTLIITPPAPVISSGPANQAVSPGGTVSLTVTASGQQTGCQWFKDGRWLVGATNTTLTLANAGLTNSGSYYAAVTNPGGMVISEPAFVTVDNPALLAWGHNLDGQLGIGSNSLYNIDLPVWVAGNVAIGTMGSDHSLFVTADGTLWGMGTNQYGQLGTSPTNQAVTPLSIISNVVAVASGGSSSLFVTTNGILWAMGYNAYGQLGTGTTSGTNANPTPVSVASNVVAIAAGNEHSLFVKANGTLWAMGNNSDGQLGNGSNTSNNLPISVASNVVAVAAGQYHSVFLKTDGTLWTMGEGNYGQLGTGYTINTNIPVWLASNVVAFAAGGYFTLFVTTNGTLWGTGLNSSGQLGGRTTSNTSTPMIVASNVVTVAVGYQHSLFVTADGTLWGMGDNTYDELGIGTNGGIYTTPITVPRLSVANVFTSSTADSSLALGLDSENGGINLSTGVPTLDFLGMPGASYNVERSTDLINWSVIWTTNEPANGIFQFTDPDPPLSNAYYQLQPSQ